MYNISNLRIAISCSNLHLSFHIEGFKAGGITEFQDIEMINCIQDSERNEREMLVGKKMKIVMLSLK